MKFLMSILFFILIGITANSKTLRVAVIDTGFTKYKTDNKSVVHPKLCKESKDFTGTGLNDTHGHGTNVAYLIAKNAGDVDYCLIILKFWDEKLHKSTMGPTKNTISSLKAAYRLNADVVNFSGGGYGFNGLESYWVGKLIIDKKTIMFAAAGNDSKYLRNEHSCGFFPACYFNAINVVGNINDDGSIHHKSNLGPMVDLWEKGVNASDGIITMTGTSQSTAIATGKFIKFYWEKKNSGKK